MITFAIPFPVIDPIAMEIGPLAIRWYALAYITGIMFGWRYALWLAKRAPIYFEAKALDDFVLNATLGIVIGGRLGYVLFYNLDYFIANPVQIFMIWQGGMSFHGGFLGVVLATWLFARKVKAPALAVGDIIAAAAPIGLFFGRIANFINAELYGRVTDVPWAMVFPNGGPEPRHPSQLYEAFLEGIVLFIILFLLARQKRVRERPGIIFGGLVIGYGIFRSMVELVREPDAHLGFIIGSLTMGQLLSIPMVLAGVALVVYGLKNRHAAARND